MPRIEIDSWCPLKSPQSFICPESNGQEQPLICTRSPQTSLTMLPWTARPTHGVASPTGDRLSAHVMSEAMAM